MLKIWLAEPGDRSARKSSIAACVAARTLDEARMLVERDTEVISPVLTEVTEAGVIFEDTTNLETAGG